MLLHPAPLLLLGVVLGSFVLGTLCASPSHSLSYFYLQLSEPTQGQNQFFIRGYLDDQPIIRFDSLNRKMEPLVPWVEEVEKERFLVPEWVFRDDLDKLSKLDYHAGGHHTWQVNLGCELREDGSKRGFLHYGYDGMDFISFDQETLRWGTAQPQAEKVKEKWEEDPRWSHGNKNFLEKTCIECLQRYLSYQKKVLQRTEPPVGKVTHKVVDDSLEVLICQAFGFYPKEIQATWRRDGEVCQNETLQRNVAPNSDGTYYVRLSIEIDPKERDHFSCYLEHKGLREPLVLALKEETGRIWWISLGIVIVMILILFLICQWWKFRKNKSQQGGKTAFHLVDGTEGEIQSQTILQPQVIVETPAEAGATESGDRMISQCMDSPGSQCPEVSEDGPVAEVTARIRCNHKDCQDHGYCLEDWKLSMKELGTHTDLTLHGCIEGGSFITSIRKQFYNMKSTGKNISNRPVTEVTPRIRCNHKACQDCGFCYEGWRLSMKELETRKDLMLYACIEGDCPVAIVTPKIQCNHKDCQDCGFCLEDWNILMKELNTRNELKLRDCIEGASSQDSEMPPVGPSAE